MWGVFETQKHECYTEFSMMIRSQVMEEKNGFEEGTRQGVVFSPPRDSVSLIALVQTLMTVAIETSRCAQLKFISQSFQPMTTKHGSRGERTSLYPGGEVLAPGKKLNQLNL